MHKLKDTDRKHYLQLAKQLQPTSEAKIMSSNKTEVTKMKHGKKYRLVPTEIYEKMVAADNRPKPPVDPQVAQLARKQKEVDQVLADQTLHPHEKVERYHEAVEEYMPLYEKMVRPKNKPSEPSDIKNLTQEIHNLVSELKGNTAPTVPYPLSPPLEAPSSSKAPVYAPTMSMFSPPGTTEMPSLSPEPIVKPKPRVTQRGRSPSPAETRSGPLAGKVFKEMFVEDPKKGKSKKSKKDGTRIKSAHGLKWKKINR